MIIELAGDAKLEYSPKTARSMGNSRAKVYGRGLIADEHDSQLPKRVTNQFIIATHASSWPPGGLYGGFFLSRFIQFIHRTSFT